MKRLMTALLFGIALIFAAPALASGDESPGDEAAHGDEAHGDEAHGDGSIPWKAIGIHAVNFIFMYGVIFALVRKPIAELLKQRQASIRQDLEQSTAARVTAQARFDELQKRLNDFDAELEQMKAGAREEAELERLYTVERTQRDAMMLREMTKGTIREERRNAARELQVQAVDTAVKLAEERLRTEIAAGDHERLANEFLGALKGQASV